MKRKLVTKPGEDAELGNSSRKRLDAVGGVKVTRSGKVLTGVAGLLSDSVPIAAVKGNVPVIKTRIVVPSSSTSSSHSRASGSSPSSALSFSTSSSSSLASRKASVVPDLKLKVVSADAGRRIVHTGTKETGGKDIERERKKKILVERLGQEKNVSIQKPPQKRTRRIVEKVGEEKPQQKNEESSQESDNDDMRVIYPPAEKNSGVEKSRVIHQRAPGKVFAITIRTRPEEDEAQEAQIESEDDEAGAVNGAEEEEEEERSLPQAPVRGHRRTAVFTSNQLSDSEEQPVADVDSEEASPRWKASQSSNSPSPSPPSRTIKLVGSRDKEDKRAKLSNGETTRNKKVVEKVSDRKADKVTREDEGSKPAKTVEEERELRALIISHERVLAKFMRTKCQPHVFFAPATHCPKSRAWQSKCERDALEQIAQIA